MWPRSCVANSVVAAICFLSYKLDQRHKNEEISFLFIHLLFARGLSSQLHTPIMDALMPTIYSYRTFLSIKMMLLRLLVAVLFHLPIVLSFPYFPTHLDLRGGSLLTEPPIPPTTTAPSIPPSLPPPSTTPISIPTTTADYWREMCKPGAECDCTRIKDKNGEE